MSKGKSHLEEGFIRTFEAVAAASPRPERQFKFHPSRKWRLDFAWPLYRLAVEIDGGIFVGGGHNRGMQFAGDADKQNALVLMGWRLLRFTTIHLRKQPVQCCEMVVELLGKITPLDAPSQRDLFAIQW